MDSLDKINLNINKILIDCGLMYGIYEDGVIKITKFGILNMAFTFMVTAIHGIKWFILIFFHEDSHIGIFLGEFSQYFGPKVVVDVACVADFVYLTISIALFYMMSNKILFWVDHLQFDSETRCFHKLNLKVSDSNKFTEQFALLWFIVKPLAYFLALISGTVVLVSFLIFKHDYYEFYLPWIFAFTIAIWKFGHNLMTLLLILYQVNKLIKCNKLNLNCKTFLLIDLLLFLFEIFLRK